MRSAPWLFVIEAISVRVVTTSEQKPTYGALTTSVMGKQDTSSLDPEGIIVDPVTE